MVDSYSHSLPISTKPLGVQGPTVLMALGTIQGLCILMSNMNSVCVIFRFVRLGHFMKLLHQL